MNTYHPIRQLYSTHVFTGGSRIKANKSSSWSENSARNWYSEKQSIIAKDFELPRNWQIFRRTIVTPSCDVVAACFNCLSALTARRIQTTHMDIAVRHGVTSTLPSYTYTTSMCTVDLYLPRVFRSSLTSYF